jgi:Domain of unknown function (DUF1841)
MIFGNDRTELRRLFAEAWRRRVANLPVEPLHDQIATVVALHPEYHALLETPAALDREWTPAEGETNPFLHMGMHLAVREQVGTDRPAGIRAAFQRLVEKHGDAHAAEHEVFECLGRALWEAQRAGRPPDEQAYLECIRSRT